VRGNSHAMTIRLGHPPAPRGGQVIDLDPISDDDFVWFTPRCRVHVLVSQRNSSVAKER
jgi:hypothetical protein